MILELRHNHQYLLISILALLILLNANIGQAKYRKDRIPETLPILKNLNYQVRSEYLIGFDTTALKPSVIDSNNIYTLPNGDTGFIIYGKREYITYRDTTLDTILIWQDYFNEKGIVVKSKGKGVRVDYTIDRKNTFYYDDKNRMITQIEESLGKSGSTDSITYQYQGSDQLGKYYESGELEFTFSFIYNSPLRFVINT